MKSKTYKPKYPIYIISKGRYENPLTAKAFIKDGVDFKIVVEPQEGDKYKEALGEKYVEVLPFSNLGLGSTPARNWCWEDSIKNGFDRHWLFDDNIDGMGRLDKGKRLRCNANLSMYVVEEFTDRYENIGISGFNYEFFVVNEMSKPYFLNVHVYSALLISNKMPFRWRMRYNEDTDLCLQVLSNSLCTVLFNAFYVKKKATMSMKGGNTESLYKGRGRLVMARALEEMWPLLVKTKWRFNRPQHSVRWDYFKHKLKRRNLDWDKIRNKKYDIKLVKNNEIKSKSLQLFYDDYMKNDKVKR